MTIEQHLTKFYLKNNIPLNGGVDDKTFKMKFGFLTFTLPNPEFRRKLTHIHDIHHLLNDCDTSWKGEGFIAGWEIASGIWKHFPVNLLSLWAMGYSLWLHPQTVYKGFLKGISQHDLIGLKYSKAELFCMDLESLRSVLKKNKAANHFKVNTMFFLWVILSQSTLLLPLIVVFYAIALLFF